MKNYFFLLFFISFANITWASTDEGVAVVGKNEVSITTGYGRSFRGGNIGSPVKQFYDDMDKIGSPFPPDFEIYRNVDKAQNGYYISISFHRFIHHKMYFKSTLDVYNSKNVSIPTAKSDTISGFEEVKSNQAESKTSVFLNQSIGFIIISKSKFEWRVNLGISLGRILDTYLGVPNYYAYQGTVIPSRYDSYTYQSMFVGGNGGSSLNYYFKLNLGVALSYDFRMGSAMLTKSFDDTHLLGISLFKKF